MKQKKCKVCKEQFTPRRPMQRVCDFKCGVALAKEDRIKARDKAHRARKRALRDNDRAFHTKQAQVAFNKFIRLRDSDLPCVSCGRMHQGQWHAGHYRPVGGPNGQNLRFCEINVWRQCMPCNAHKSGSLTTYRVELINRIGIDLVEWLEKDHKKIMKWTVPELKAIRKYYTDAHKAMLASTSHCHL